MRRITYTRIDVIVDKLVHESPLYDLDSVIVTSHVAWYSESSLDELRRKATEEVVCILMGMTIHMASATRVS